MRPTTCHTYVIKLDLKYAELSSQWSMIWDILFSRRYTNDIPNIHKLINTIALSTRVRRSFNDPDNENDETICMFYRFDYVELPRFTSPLISVWSEKLDPREFKRCNKSDYLYLLSTDIIRFLHPSEQTYILKTIQNYIDHYLPRNSVKILK